MSDYLGVDAADGPIAADGGDENRFFAGVLVGRRF